MTKIIVIGSGGLSAALASLQSENVAVETAEDHSVAGMLEGLRAAREERTVADYSMENVNALFEDIFGHDINVEMPIFSELRFTDAEADALMYGTESVGPEFPGLHMLFGIGEDEEEALDAEMQEQMSFGRAYDALMRMLDVFSQVSGSPVTSEQRIAMTLLLSNDETAEAFATAAEDLVDSGLFE